MEMMGQTGAGQTSDAVLEIAALAVSPDPVRRRRKATRCRSCGYCRPRGAGEALRLCAHPEHHATIVVGDQMVCADFSSPSSITVPAV